MVELVPSECSQPGPLTRWSHAGAGGAVDDTLKIRYRRRPRDREASQAHGGGDRLPGVGGG